MILRQNEWLTRNSETLVMDPEHYEISDPPTTMDDLRKFFGLVFGLSSINSSQAIENFHSNLNIKPDIDNR